MSAEQNVARFTTRSAHNNSGAFRSDGLPDRSLAVFLALLALLFAFRCLALAANSTDLFVDEAQYWAWAQEPAFGYLSKPPLIAWIIHATTSVCGDGEACVRLPSTILHLATAAIVYAIGRELYSSTVGLWAGLGYALLPAVSLSSGIISTDAPLLTAWAAALYAFIRLLKAPTAAIALLLALALGIGLNAKYAMAYFVLSGAVVFAIAPEHRARLREPHLWLALAGGLALLVPNLVWNAQNGFATLAHTADNANWRGVPFNPHKAAEFLLAQFGVFGPILFGTLLVIAVRAGQRATRLAPAHTLLLAFSLPILLLVTAQALISRAYANWAAPAYVAAVVLVTATMIEDRAHRWMQASFALHIAAALLIAAATWQAGRLALPGLGDPFARTLGNHALAAAVRNEVDTAARAGHPYGSILTDTREIRAALAYYGRDIALPVRSWRAGPAPRTHFELAGPFDASAPLPALLVTPHAAPPLAAHFETVTPHGTREIPAGRSARRIIHLSTLARFKER